MVVSAAQTDNVRLFPFLVPQLRSRSAAIAFLLGVFRRTIRTIGSADALNEDEVEEQTGPIAGGLRRNDRYARQLGSADAPVLPSDLCSTMDGGGGVVGVRALSHSGEGYRLG